MAAPGLAQPIGEGDTETTWSRRKRTGTPLGDIMAERTGIGLVACRDMRVGTAALPISGVSLGKGVTTGAGSGSGASSKRNTIKPE